MAAAPAATPIPINDSLILWTPSPTIAPLASTATTSAQRLPSAVKATRPPGLATTQIVIARRCADVTIPRSEACKPRFRGERNRRPGRRSQPGREFGALPDGALGIELGS